MDRLPKIGIDVGGTKLAAIAFDANDEIVFDERVDTPKRDYRAGLAAIRSLVERARTAIGGSMPPQVGIGIPGSISPTTGLVQNANSTWMNGKDFAGDIQAALGCDVRIANDANCLALSEHHDGAAVGAEIVFAVILGTGCGGALVVNGQLLTGSHALTGEWGHTPLPSPSAVEWPGPKCWCGHHGCLELWVSGSGLERSFKSATGLSKSAEDIFTGAVEGNEACTVEVDAHADRVARGLAMVANLIDPDVIVVGGGLSNVTGLFADVAERMPRYVFSRHYTPNIVPARHGDASGVRGAARLWERQT